MFNRINYKQLCAYYFDKWDSVSIKYYRLQKKNKQLRKLVRHYEKLLKNIKTTGMHS
jgi:hypothetical protein